MKQMEEQMGGLGGCVCGRAYVANGAFMSLLSLA